MRCLNARGLFDLRSSAKGRKTVLCAALFSLGALVGSPGFAQKVDENAVTRADDAFGLEIGHESLGLYNEGAIRGFSPGVAGNYRIDGLYFDEQASLSSRVQSFTTLRVALAAQEYVFPAPTGIVDITLKRAETANAVSTVLALGPFSSNGVEYDVARNLRRPDLSVSGGFSWYRNHFSNGGGSTTYNLGLTPNWKINADVEVSAFADISGADHETSQGVYQAQGPFTPQTIKRNQYPGPNWDFTNSLGVNAGVLSRFKLAGWSYSFGIFRSEFRSGTSFLNLFTLDTPLTAGRSVTAFPSSISKATSGEWRAERTLSDGAIKQVLTVMLRGREEQHVYGSGSQVDFGKTSLNGYLEAPRHVFDASPRTREIVRQLTEGLSYSIGRTGFAEVTLGATHTYYKHDVHEPNLTPTTHADELWQPSLSIAAHPNTLVTLYGSAVHGLEDSGFAPSYAANAHQVAPASRTTQWEMGLKSRLPKSGAIVLGYFYIKKPYIGLNQSEYFGTFGTETHRGFEISYNQHPIDGLTIVAGAVLYQPRARAKPTDTFIGSRPAGLSDNTFQLNIDYILPFFSSISIDSSINYQSKQFGQTDNAVKIPAYGTLDIGGRYKFAIGKHKFSARVQMTNLTNEYSLVVLGSGFYVPTSGRAASAYLSTDW